MYVADGGMIGRHEFKDRATDFTIGDSYSDIYLAFYPSYFLKGR